MFEKGIRKTRKNNYLLDVTTTLHGHFLTFKDQLDTTGLFFQARVSHCSKSPYFVQKFVQIEFVQIEGLTNRRIAVEEKPPKITF